MEENRIRIISFHKRFLIKTLVRAVEWRPSVKVVDSLWEFSHRELDGVCQLHVKLSLLETPIEVVDSLWEFSR